ncbi:unnamed protein product, partial [Prorocentrum cordatum]
TGYQYQQRTVRVRIRDRGQDWRQKSQGGEGQQGLWPGKFPDNGGHEWQLTCGQHFFTSSFSKVCRKFTRLFHASVFDRTAVTHENSEGILPCC